MNDKEVLQHIDELIAEEHELRAKATTPGLTDTERAACTTWTSSWTSAGTSYANEGQRKNSAKTPTRPAPVHRQR